MPAADLHPTARRAYLWCLGAVAAVFVTITAATVLAFFDQSVWFERIRLVFHVIAGGMMGGALTATAQMRRETAPPAAHRKENT